LRSRVHLALKIFNSQCGEGLSNINIIFQLLIENDPLVKKVPVSDEFFSFLKIAKYKAFTQRS